VTVPAERLAARHRALAATLEPRALAGLLVSHLPNIAYLTGFDGSAALALASPSGVVLLSDARYGGTLESLRAQVPGLTAFVVQPGEAGVEEAAAKAVERLGGQKVGVEAPHLSVRAHLDLGRRLAEAGCQTVIEPVDGLVEDLRVVKDAWEIETLREAGQRLSEVAKCIIPKALRGVVERELAAIIESELRRRGFDKPAFDTIVASGANAALPHYRAGDRRFERGDLVVMDFGGMFRGYAVDMTRTVTIGPATSRQSERLAAVAEAQRAGFRAAAIGVRGDAVDGAARQVLVEAGMGEAFGHGLGHGLGLEVHERPRLSMRRPGLAAERLAAGMVFTLEPGVYFPGWGGVRTEDDVVLTDRGPEWITEPVSEA
jgi:Xaa-Pro aminopeptidase